MEEVHYCIVSPLSAIWRTSGRLFLLLYTWSCGKNGHYYTSPLCALHRSNKQTLLPSTNTLGLIEREPRERLRVKEKKIERRRALLNNRRLRSIFRILTCIRVFMNHTAAHELNKMLKVAVSLWPILLVQERNLK